ncbi:MAG: hypothetical protein A2700_00300 [Candidatus Blackburnbacteria bacterium RIFCSPHIGHO2_01_FULL_44_64]|uniref:Transposase IS200-like domain-containing protein n=1 Tax=Candidatus Blackburnbacteria bacterium RIFCSPHIGHO2_02_FULL_44_20 TaxID=1797516 RepID=A0A1G1V7E0_9BACT|nr:MAG: hypothetical protein A2700_00300 [Candidatus Blackburnbacteria bacterium RIFCSPHIGHO2_01_FULL_44_64]OGY10218.1 MAG: hypothetical protein A3E16_03345 [Candidatus Blackburnbacteria bacterium RIFCSPHIGHO2_12_FULL_44_25]OGY11359.1 MAG: hypothetical protein A3D26_02540 [Candidatus Blackburnbacteria bacterium RIFCSPHIGHO2_02_FULL_44_20]OGY13535.1 MAG: hypothetical protein A3A62_00965 [Candidatus Blackburnbacteria bacterium RIFCSPLOWO2_01_FULL_44_43]OGY16499.1 MAG: hypothetical protein A3H88_0
MPTRIIPLGTGEFYHVFNRGIAKQPVFLDKRDYRQMILGLSYYRFAVPPIRLSFFKTLPLDQKSYLWKELQTRNEKLVEIVAFALMPNHFHLLLRQEAENGISTFMRRLANSYTRFFNTKDGRKGPIFQGVFKAVHVSTTEQLMHVSRYIHVNPVVSYVIKESEMFSYPWTSLPEFLGDPSMAMPEPVLSLFSSKDDYKDFVLDQVDYGKRLEEIKHLVFE